MKKRRGSVLVFVVVLVAAITTIILATAELSMGAVRAQEHWEEQVRARNAFEGAISQIVAEQAAGMLTLPAVKTINVTNIDCDVSVTDNSISMKRTMRVELKAKVGDREFAEARVVSMRGVPKTFDYAVMVDGNLSLDKPLITGASAANGDMRINGYLELKDGTSEVNGDVDLFADLRTPTLKVEGNVTEGLLKLNFPVASKSAYDSAPSTKVTLSGLVGHTFITLLGGDLLVKTGSLNLAGVFAGRGAIFVDGDAVITGNMSYLDASSAMCVIATGKVRVTSGVTAIVGYFYAGNSFEVEGSAGTVTLSRGAITARSISLARALNVTHDPAVWNDSSLGTTLKMPGYWP